MRPSYSFHFFLILLQNPRNLKNIDLSYSEELVDVPNLSEELVDVPNLSECLESICLKGCTSLDQIPDLSKCLNIVSINLEGCKKLVEVPSYFENLHKLTYLNLRECPSLKSFPAAMPSNMEFLLLGADPSLVYGTDYGSECSELPLSIWSLEKLVELDLYGFHRIENLPNSTWRLYSLTSLDFSKMSIEGLPSSIECLSRVVSIKLQSCYRLVSLPTSICKLKSLKELDLSGCSKFKFFPEIPETMECLEVLHLRGTVITELHESIECLSRVVSITLQNCNRLGSLPTSIGKLKSLKELDLSGCSTFKSFPEISERMECLEVLNLRRTDITELHKSIGTTLVGLKKLDLYYCESLVSVPDSIWELNRLEIFRLDGCLKLMKLRPSSSVILGSLISNLDLSCCTRLEEIPAGLMSCLTSLTSLISRNCERLQSLTGLPCLLRILDVDGCTNLRVVSFSMAAVTQGLDQTRDEENYSFRSCINLENNAKNNIIDNAQLRIMRMATAYSKHKQINPEFKNLHFFHEYYFGIVYPGNEIPPWFRYQTEGSSITIKLPVHPSHTNTNFWQICLCAVLTIDEDEDEHRDWFRYIHEPIAPNCKYNFTTNNGYSSQFEIRMPPDIFTYDPIFIYSLDQSQVFVWYLRDWPTHVSNAREASFEFNPYDQFEEDGEADEFYLARVKVKRCGVCLLHSQGQDVVAVDQDVGEP